MMDYGVSLVVRAEALRLVHLRAAEPGDKVAEDPRALAHELGARGVGGAALGGVAVEVVERGTPSRWRRGGCSTASRRLHAQRGGSALPRVARLLLRPAPPRSERSAACEEAGARGSRRTLERRAGAAGASSAGTDPRPRAAGLARARPRPCSAAVEPQEEPDAVESYRIWGAALDVARGCRPYRRRRDAIAPRALRTPPSSCSSIPLSASSSSARAAADAAGDRRRVVGGREWRAYALDGVAFSRPTRSAPSRRSA